MADPRPASSLLLAATVLAAALALAPVLRGVTAGLNETVGRAWPFSLSHCRASTTPGCEAEDPGRRAEAQTRMASRATR